jgi:hypothetical protein
MRVDAAFRVGMPCAREERLPLRKTKRKTKKKSGVSGGAKRRQLAGAETG